MRLIFVLPVHSDQVFLFFPVPLTSFWYKDVHGGKRKSMKRVKMAFIPVFFLGFNIYVAMRWGLLFSAKSI